MIKPTIMQTPNTIITKFNAALFSLCLLICALFFSWVILAQVNFGYPVLHSIMNIEQHIAKYGPQNRYRDDFETTDKPEQIRLFAAIVESIHNDGQGLDDITYHSKQGQEISTLLHKAEVVHLKDVAHLINQFYQVSMVTLLLALVLIVWFKLRGPNLPNIKQQILGILSFSTICFILVLLIGPVKVFYALHEWVFPENHQWFFFYQESLMTILMKAPDLFGAISGFIAILGIVIYLLLNRIILTLHPIKNTNT